MTQHSKDTEAMDAVGRAREYLLLASYCGSDNGDCTERRPCADCLSMCNIFGADDVFVRELGPALRSTAPAPDYCGIVVMGDEPDEDVGRLISQLLIAAHEERMDDFRALLIAALSTPRDALVAAGNRLSLAAQTSGGTAGRDSELVAAIDGWAAALRAQQGDQ